jgi:hypothetical protein
MAKTLEIELKWLFYLEILGNKPKEKPFNKKRLIIAQLFKRKLRNLY